MYLLLLAVAVLFIPVAFGFWGRELAVKNKLRFGFVIGFFFGILGIIMLYLAAILKNVRQ